MSETLYRVEEGPKGWFTVTDGERPYLASYNQVEIQAYCDRRNLIQNAERTAADLERAWKELEEARADFDRRLDAMQSSFQKRIEMLQEAHRAQLEQSQAEVKRLTDEVNRVTTLPHGREGV